ncbi:hypothetical protein MGG_00152 [Pyricularia oryzae 70-15]|uniref:SET domain-containing protein n=3 Tax=Pyricularia oryzae TaxID=318829 RepID=G4NE62_PYRO7|nr:uncharacterized protein MGG_00152 [Pyricularia oryzae 70-15]EHA49391.1 hypothetical protein MGG_00152 [Pyricularia oryzae 70-15]ELQ41577.1 hypothetical protein OOU_Y34scaffold00267g14 [Pyricularia oryzae Y34]KAI7920819.1 hypothetical protein M0657_006398 [Pyricularia oryzae]KAI7927035.1 hypothetical protein M9X92_002367 [Pyricularia oryzae]
MTGKLGALGSSQAAFVDLTEDDTYDCLVIRPMLSSAARQTARQTTDGSSQALTGSRGNDVSFQSNTSNSYVAHFSSAPFQGAQRSVPGPSPKHGRANALNGHSGSPSQPSPTPVIWDIGDHRERDDTAFKPDPYAFDNYAGPYSPMSKLRTTSPRGGLRDNPVPNSTSESVVSPVRKNNVTPHKGKSVLSIETIEAKLIEFLDDVCDDHMALVKFCHEDTFADLPERQNLSATDHFMTLKAEEVGHQVNDNTAMKIKIKQHGGRDGPQKQRNSELRRYRAVCIKSDKKAVPSYRFHHVQIGKNILSPNAGLKFTPHLRDMGAAEERTFNMWISELKEMDRKSGLDVDKQGAEGKRMIQRDELAATISLYLDHWLEQLKMECTKSTLIRHMASHGACTIDSPQGPPKHALTPKQRSSILDSHSTDTDGPGATAAATNFTIAFNNVFRGNLTLHEVLSLEETVEIVMDTRTRIRDAAARSNAQEELPDESLVKTVGAWLTSYTSQGCLICFRHSCEHGEYLGDNSKRPFSIDLLGGMEVMLKSRLVEEAEKNHTHREPGRPRNCSRKCYVSYQTGNREIPSRQWNIEERMILRCLFLVLNTSDQPITVAAQCVVAEILDINCFEVHREVIRLRLERPQELHGPVGSELENNKRVKVLDWYDKNRKMLMGDWKQHTRLFESARFEGFDPCIHDGPCTVANGCNCAKLGVFCERFCRCTAESCALKFTGCACHASGGGKTCLSRQREGRPCICVQLNRECDPVLCGGCGAKERGDPKNAFNETLHRTGCQNCPLQRGVHKPLCLGESGIEGCGYGLFTAVDIAADEFIIEYVGELIQHDEGVRREARRGNVFDEESNVSYLFTLLEDDGIWVDAAVYGNLSRYMNHASESDRNSCNVVPKIVQVNGDFRIRFTALRDIKAGEELFFNYGENFPNLTKQRRNEADEERNAASKPAQGAAKVDGEYRTPGNKQRRVANKTPGPKPRGKRGGARPGAGRKPNSAKLALAQAAAAKQKKKPCPKPRSGGVTGANGARKSISSVVKPSDPVDVGYETEAAAPYFALKDDHKEDEDHGDNDDGEYRGPRTAAGASGTSEQNSSQKRSTAATSRLRKRKFEGENGDDDDDGEYAGTTNNDDARSSSEGGNVAVATTRPSTRRSGAGATRMRAANARLVSVSISPTGTRRNRPDPMNVDYTEVMDSSVEDEDDDEDVDDVLDRSRRRRQPPVRYRRGP